MRYSQTTGNQRIAAFPEWATHLGDSRYNDRLTDLSPAGIELRKAHERDMLDRIRGIDRRQLAGQDVISFDLFLRDKELAVESQRFPEELLAVTQMDGPQISFGQLVAAMPFFTSQDYENYIKRLESFPLYLEQVSELLRNGIREGWVTAGIPLRTVPAQIEGLIASAVRESPLYRPFAKYPQDLHATDQQRISATAESVIGKRVIPALRAFHSFIVSEYLPACRSSVSAQTLPDGGDYYQYQIRRLTTTDRTPAEIHEMGLQEVSRIRRAMESLVRTLGYTGSFEQFLTYLRTDPQFYYTTSAELIAGYSVIAKRMDAELPRLFSQLPRTPYGIREIPLYEAPAQTTAYYVPGAADGSRAGYYYVNTYKLSTRPKYEMEALSLHESVPGHHLQIARAQELQNLPDFRRNAQYTAYVEGWALYAESLGEDIEFYSDEYSRFGRLTYEMWRACRLVVDTGIHAFSWTRQQAIDYMLENSAKTENDVIVEVDRYIVWPAQALTYKLGELKIKELGRQRSRF